MYNETEVDLFFQRLESEKNKDDPRLAFLLSSTEKSQVFDFLLSKETRDKIARLQKGEVLVFGRAGKSFDAGVDLPRKIVILCDKKEKLYALLDHKSKKAEKEKIPGYRPLSGVYKSGKDAYRIDEPENWFSARMEVSPRELEGAETEANLSQMLNEQYFNKTQLGPLDKSRSTVTFYSLRAQEDLKMWFEKRRRGETRVYLSDYRRI